VIGIVDILHPESIEVRVPIKPTTTAVDFHLLAFFWLPAVSPEYGDLVVVTSQGVEIWRLSYETLLVKQVKKFTAPIRLCWFEAATGVVVAAVGPRTLQPYALNSKTSSKLPKFEVQTRSPSIESHHISVMSLYEWTFCIHLDSISGRVSLRSLTGPRPSDIQIEIDGTLEGYGAGPMKVSRVDHMLAVHRMDRGITMVFDIKEGRTLHTICAPASMEPGPCETTLTLKQDGGSETGIVSKSSIPLAFNAIDMYSHHWRFVNPDIILDYAAGAVYRVEVNLDMVVEDLMKFSKTDLIKVLLRRVDCKMRVLFAIRYAIQSETPPTEVSQMFAVTNQVYRNAIERVPHKEHQKGRAGPKRATVSLDTLIQLAVGSQSHSNSKAVCSTS
jgi:hypothetical protein